MSDGDGVKRVKSREFTGISPLQLAGTGVKLVKTRVVFVGYFHDWIEGKVIETFMCAQTREDTMNQTN